MYCNCLVSDLVNRGIHLCANAQLEKAILSLARGVKVFWKYSQETRGYLVGP